MKRFIVSILSISVFFVGLGTLAEKAGAKFKSDERALGLIRAARQAIGGDSAIAAVQSMSITAQTTRTFRHDGTERTMQGETEIALQLPDKLMKKIKLGDGGMPEEGEKMMRKHVNVIVTGDGDAAAAGDKGDVKTVILRKGDPAVGEVTGESGQKVIVKKVDGGNVQWKTEADGQQANGDVVLVRKGPGHDEMRQNELLRTTLGLLLSAPQGIDVSYTFAGEGSVDGTPCNIIEATAAGSSIKLYLGKDSNLPVMMSYIGTDMPQIIQIEKTAGGDAEKGNMVFTRRSDAPESAEIQVRFSDYRTVAGLQLPYRWVQSVNGAVGETTEVTSYEINPANIADKFSGEKVMLRTKQADDQ
jgi:hypothetical protein